MKNTPSPFILTVMSTKGGVTKSTNVANIGAFCADCGLKVLMIDTDVQPTLSSYYPLSYEAPQGLFEFLVNDQTEPSQIISKTVFENLHVIQSNDQLDRVSDHLRNEPAGILKLHTLLRNHFQDYDLIIIDTRGTRGITVDMSVLASHLVLSPIKPELLSAKEFKRGTIGLYKQLQTFEGFGLTLPKVKTLISCLDNTNDARMVVDTLKDIFLDAHENIELLDLTIPSRVAYREASGICTPIHRHAKKEIETIRSLCLALFPQWTDKLQSFRG